MATVCANIPPVSGVRSLLGVFTNPRAVLRSQLAAMPIPLCLLVSGSAFCLFYLQTGLDIHSAGYYHNHSTVVLMAVLGLFVGTVGVALLAALAWGLTRPFGVTQPVSWAIRAFALAYVPALLYAFLGLLANVALHWHTSLAFGVTGVLWALGPMLAAIREMTGQRTGPAVVVATVCGALTLVLWALIVR